MTKPTTPGKPLDVDPSVVVAKVERAQKSYTDWLCVDCVGITHESDGYTHPCKQCGEDRGPTYKMPKPQARPPIPADTWTRIVDFAHSELAEADFWGAPDEYIIKHSGQGGTNCSITVAHLRAIAATGEPSWSKG